MSTATGYVSGKGAAVRWLVLAVALTAAGGCGGGAGGPAVEDLEAFMAAGPDVVGGVELNEFLRAQVPVGNYRLVPGDLLSVHMPAVMAMLGGGLDGQAAEAVERRVRRDGTIRLPGLDEDLPVEHLTVAEAERVIEGAYQQRIINRPSVVVNVLDFDAIYVSVAGSGIVRPGLYRLRSDERSLSALLMRAGGIVPQGASMIRVRPPGVAGNGKTLELPVRDTSVPLEDVILVGGESIEVVSLPPAFITFVGQVNAPGRYPIDPVHPPTLIEALATAGGVREIEDPRYVSVFRRAEDGAVVSARFSLPPQSGTSSMNLFHKNELGEGSFAPIKPGDILVVDRTVRSRTRQFIARAFSISFTAGAHASGTYHRDWADEGTDRDYGGAYDSGPYIPPSR